MLYVSSDGISSPKRKTRDRLLRSAESDEFRSSKVLTVWYGLPLLVLVNDEIGKDVLMEGIRFVIDKHLLKKSDHVVGKDH